MHHLASPRTLYSTSLFYNTSFGRFSLLLLPPHECSASGMSGCSSATGYTPYYGSTRDPSGRAPVLRKFAQRDKH
jgi:hypothetical protein